MVADNMRNKVLPQKDQYSAMAADRVAENKEDKARPHLDLGLAVAVDIQAHKFEGIGMEALPVAAALAPAPARNEG